MNSRKKLRAGKGTSGQLLPRRILREDIRDQLIAQILDGRLAPGDRIVETRVAQRFGVSQAPVREALRDLELFGFIVSAPFRGAIVRKISMEDVVQIYPVRAVIEGLAAREAATRLDEKGLKRLEQLLAELRKAAARGDARAMVDADFAFHLIIVDASGNWLLKQFWERMRLQTTTFLTVLQSHMSLIDLADRHAVVIDALRSRDPDTAEHALRHHIQEPGLSVQAAIRKASTESAAAAPAPAVRKPVTRG